MKKWLLSSAVLLAGCLFQENSGSASEWAEKNGLDLKGRIQHVEVKDLGFSWNTPDTNYFHLASSERLIHYQASNGLTKTIGKGLWLGELPSDQGTLVSKAHFNFDVTDTNSFGTGSQYGFAAADVYDKDADSLKLLLYIEKNYYNDLNPAIWDSLKTETFTYKVNYQINHYGKVFDITEVDGALEYDEVEFKGTFQAANDSVIDAKRRVDSLRFATDYWRELLLETYPSESSGQISEVSASIVSCIDQWDENAEEVDSANVTSGHCLELRLSEELVKALQTKNTFQNLSLSLEPISAPLLRLSSEFEDAGRPRLMYDAKISDALISAWEANESDLSAVIAGVGKGAEFALDWKQIGNALEAKGVELGKSSHMVLSAELKAELNEPVSLESIYESGAWLFVQSQIDSTEEVDYDLIVEYQIPPQDSSLGSEGSSFWIEPGQTESLSWFVNHSARYFVREGKAVDWQRLQMVLAKGPEEPDFATMDSEGSQALVDQAVLENAN